MKAVSSPKAHGWANELHEGRGAIYNLVKGARGLDNMFGDEEKHPKYF